MCEPEVFGTLGVLGWRRGGGLVFRTCGQGAEEILIRHVTQLGHNISDPKSQLGTRIIMPRVHTCTSRPLQLSCIVPCATRGGFVLTL